MYRNERQETADDSKVYQIYERGIFLWRSAGAGHRGTAALFHIERDPLGIVGASAKRDEIPDKDSFHLDVPGLCCEFSLYTSYWNSMSKTWSRVETTLVDEPLTALMQHQVQPIYADSLRSKNVFSDRSILHPGGRLSFGTMSIW